VITSFFLDVSVTIPYNVTMGNATANWTEIVNGTFTGLSGNTPAGISELFYSNLYPNYKQVKSKHLKDQYSTRHTVYGTGIAGIYGTVHYN
jgi:hypothetical protein